VVNDKSINAFALPGGPTFVHTGLLGAVDNEAQLAGVMAHEIAHVALRHGTNQATKANALQLGMMLAGKALGSGSMLAQLGQLGIGLGANSVLLKFSRSAETEADLLGARIMAQAGYNPVEMARFFQKLEGEGGARGPQFLSDHPNPGNRMKAIQQEITYLPKTSYTADTRQLPKAKTLVAQLPAPKKVRSEAETAAAAPSIPNSRPTDRMLEYQGKEFRITYPENWKVFQGQDSPGVTIAPPSGIQQSQQGVNVGYGVMVNGYAQKSQGTDLMKATDELVAQIRSGDPELKITQATRETTAGGQRATVTKLAGRSMFEGQAEDVSLITVARSGGVVYLVCVAPQSEAQYANRVFDRMVQSLRFTQ
jgi:hypothetical protein